MKIFERVRRFFSWEDTETDEEYLDNITANMTEKAIVLDEVRIQRWKTERDKEPYQ